MNNVPTIHSSAMLLDMNISVYTGRRTDRRTASEVMQSKGASAGSASVQKYLFAGDNDLQNIVRHAAHSRDVISKHTLPWNDYGTRLVSTESFFDLTTKLNELRDEFYHLVNLFVDNYAHKVSNAAFSLGTMFDREEYPAPEMIKERFSFMFTFGPVPSEGDFRVDIPNEAMQLLRDEFATTNNDRIESAVSDILQRLINMAQTMYEKCVTPEDGPRPRIHESTFTHAQELCEIAKDLNLFNDPDIEAIRHGIEVALTGIDVDTLRKSPEVRESVRTKMDDILQRFA